MSQDIEVSDAQVRVLALMCCIVIVILSFLIAFVQVSRDDVELKAVVVCIAETSDPACTNHLNRRK